MSNLWGGVLPLASQPPPGHVSALGRPIYASRRPKCSERLFAVFFYLNQSNLPENSLIGALETLDW